MRAEPARGIRLGGGQIESALGAIADFTDVKSPYTIGHSRWRRRSRGRGRLRVRAGEPAARRVRLAGLVHDLGRLGVPNTIWDKHGPLSHAETERVRLHPYLTERMLARSPALAPLAAIAVQHHERLDGSGYPRGLSGGAISPGGPAARRRRLLPLADRATPAPARVRLTRLLPSCGPRPGPAGSTPRRRPPCSPLRGIVPPAGGPA